MENRPGGDDSEATRRKRQELQRLFDADYAAIERILDAASAPLRKVRIPPRAADLEITEVALVWTPWRRNADGQTSAAFEVSTA